MSHTTDWQSRWDAAMMPNYGTPPVVLDHGSKLMEGTAAEAQSDPRVVEAYLGKEVTDDAA